MVEFDCNYKSDKRSNPHVMLAISNRQILNSGDALVVKVLFCFANLKMSCLGGSNRSRNYLWEFYWII